MKTSFAPFFSAIAAAILAAGCETGHDQGPYLAQTVKTPPYENTEQFVLLDPGVQYSVTRGDINQRTLEDGRLEIIAQLRNRENRRIEVQANCVFKDQTALSLATRLRSRPSFSRRMPRSNSALCRPTTRRANTPYACARRGRCQSWSEQHRFGENRNCLGSRKDCPPMA